jgi:2-dehydro-3-deoxygalactonokinase
MIITVDCGTTNMRCRLFDGAAMLDEVCRRAGVRNTAFDGTADFLRTSLKSSVAELLEQNSLRECDVEVIISSGTLASDVGIFTVPHVKAPVGVNESAAHARLVTLDDITAIPILFIPGVKTLPGEDESNDEKIIEALESMSGEECETYGIMAQLGLTGNFAITLPGSYNKAIEINGAGQIISIKTGMCGEFIAAIAEHTLLRRFLPQPVIRTIIPEKLYEGFDYSIGHGVSPSLIKARMVRFMRSWSEDEAANFFVGAILKDDIAITKGICLPGRKLVVGGGNPLRHIFALLLEHAGVGGIVEVSDETAHVAPSIGAMKVYEAYLRQSGK